MTTSGSKRHVSRTAGKVGGGASAPCASTAAGATASSRRASGRAVRRIGLIVTRNRGNRRAGSGVNGAMNRSAPGLFVVLLVILAACATPGGSPGASETDGGGSASPPASASDGGGETGGIEHPTGADEPILIVEEAGGFAMPQMIATRVPTFALYGGGRVIMQGMQTLEFPGPALPALIERTMTEDGIQAVLEAVE